METRSVLLSFSVLQGMFLYYMSEKHDRDLVDIVSGIIREFATNDIRGFDIDDFRKHVEESKDLAQKAAVKSFMMQEIDAFYAKRNHLRPATPPSPLPIGRSRTINVWERNSRLNLNLFDFAILHYYASKTDRTESYVLGVLLRTYMLADKRLQTGELEAFITRQRSEITKDEYREMKDDWSSFLEQRSKLGHKPKAVRAHT